MARINYQANEAYDIIKNRFNDPDTFVDFVRKFPGFAAVLLSGDMETLCKGIPFGSARQFDKSIWGVLNGEGKEEESEVSNEEEEETEASNEKEGDGDSKYAGMSPKKLFTLCQEAGLKVKEKQPAEYYIEKLEYADKKKAATEPEETEDDDWGDEDEKPAKGKGKGKGKTKKEAKKEAKKEEDDDDDDWDF